MRGPAPQISVVIPAFNAARFIGLTIDSVLRQTHSDYEIIVVDDGSTDTTPQEVSRHQERIRYVWQDNQGLAAARNAGASVARGEYLAFLDSDDLFLPHKLQVQAAALEGDSNLSLVASGYDIVNESGHLIRHERPWLAHGSPNLESIVEAGLTVVHAVLLRRSWFERVGGFDRQFRAAEDMDLWFRLAVAGAPMAWVPSIVCQYRLHGANMSRSVRNHYRAYYAALDKLLANPAAPDALRDKRPKLYAQAKLAEAGRLYAVNDIENAKNCLTTALDLDPYLAGSEYGRLIETIAAWEQQEVWNQDSSGVLARVFANLPDGLPDHLQKHVSATRAKATVYRAFESGDARKVRRFWAAVARAEPAWLLNRGAWSILLQSLGVLQRRVAP